MEQNYDAIRISSTLIVDLFQNKFDNKLKYSIKTVNIDSIIPTSLYIKYDRFLYAQYTAKSLIEKRISLYEPHIKYDGDSYRFVPPPIVELRREGLILCDGTHRIMTAKEFHVNRVVVLLVENAYRPLAGDITSWDRIKTTDLNYKTKDNFLNYCHEGMTGYSKFCNSDKMIIKIPKEK